MNYYFTQSNLIQQSGTAKRMTLPFFNAIQKTAACLMVLLLVLLSNAGDAQPTSGLVGYFTLDGNVNNTGSGSITAAANNTTYTTNGAGVSNKAIKFAGSISSDVVITDNGNLDFIGDFSIAFGLNMSSLAGCENSRGTKTVIFKIKP